jgi:uncharacterized protein YcbX
MGGRIIGHVAALARFPVKSMAGEPLEVAEIDWQGVEGDRQYGFHFAGSHSRFPWCTGRDYSELVLHRARFADPAAPRTSPVEIDGPSGWRGMLHDPLLAAEIGEAAGAPVALMQLGIGAYDAAPVSVSSSAGHAAVEAAHGGALDLRRFRINIVIDSDELESAWHGHQLAFGEDGAAINLTHGIPRCAMVTIDPDTAARDPSVLRTIAQQFGNIYGAYGATARKGLVRVGDAVRIAD